MISIWIRNSFLNLFILAMGGAALLMLPLLLICIFEAALRLRAPVLSKNLAPKGGNKSRTNWEQITEEHP